MRLPGWRSVGVVAGGLLAYALVVRHWQQDGALRERIKARETVIAALATKSSRVDTLYTQDTIRLTRAITRVRAVRDTLRITDTVAVRHVLAASDEALRACSAVVQNCENRVAIRDTIIHEKDALIADLKRRNRGFRILGLPLGCTAGLAGTPQGVNIGGSCGIRLR